MVEYTSTSPLVPIPPAYSPKTSYGWREEKYETSKRPSTLTSTISLTSDLGSGHLHGYLSYEDHKNDLEQIDLDRKHETFQLELDTESLKSTHGAEVVRSKNLVPLYIIVGLSKSRYYIRGFAIIVMILSMALILTGVVQFSHAKGNPNFQQVPKPAPISDQPCIVFTGIAAMNLVLSGALLLTSCFSFKFRKSNNAISAVFTIVSAIGFSSAMGACFFLNKKTTLENDLWKWSCDNSQKGITSAALDFTQVCSIISYSWHFGLVQAALELLTFIISIVFFILLRYFNLAKHGVY